jgi:hypothetical protein
MAAQWLKEHPFVNGPNIQNAVFECFLLAKLMVMKEHQLTVLRYLQTRYKTAHMLFSLFDKLCTERTILSEYLPFLFSSLKSMDTNEKVSGVTIAATGVDGDEIFECDVEFYNEHDQAAKYEFNMVMDGHSSIVLNGSISNFELAAPIDVKLQGVRIEFESPVIINCRNILVNMDDIIVNKGKEGDVIFECDDLHIQYSDGKTPQITSRVGKNGLIVFSDKKPAHPFADYHHDATTELGALDPALTEKYLRLRTIMMQFRSHSKGQLAKFQDKIEHQRVYKNDIGWSVLEKMKETGILYKNAHLYVVDNAALDLHVGLSYFDFKRKAINEKAIVFLQAI